MDPTCRIEFPNMRYNLVKLGITDISECTCFTSPAEKDGPDEDDVGSPSSTYNDDYLAKALAMKLQKDTCKIFSWLWCCQLIHDLLIYLNGISAKHHANMVANTCEEFIKFDRYDFNWSDVPSKQKESMQPVEILPFHVCKIMRPGCNSRGWNCRGSFYWWTFPEINIPRHPIYAEISIEYIVLPLLHLNPWPSSIFSLILDHPRQSLRNLQSLHGSHRSPGFGRSEGGGNHVPLAPAKVYIYITYI